MDQNAQALFTAIDANRQSDIELLKSWSAINSGTFNLSGLEAMLGGLRSSFAALNANEELIDLPEAESIDSTGKVTRAKLGRALRLLKRPNAPRQVFLNIHYDTVYGKDHAFQAVKDIDADTINGPGACDAKGGIVVMLAALRAIENSPSRDQLGWEVFLNPDEEIGSPGSSPFFREVGQRQKIGLLFEPALPDGSIVGERKGSGNFTAVVRGKSAHAGRDFHAGRSATVALADLILKVDQLNETLGNGVTINCGKIEGGGAVNVVPDLAIGRFNVRITDPKQAQQVSDAFNREVQHVMQRDGITIKLHGGFASPPKVIDAKSQRLIDAVRACAMEVGLGELAVKSSGGASDGNKLSAAGVAVVDTLGPVGGEIHSDREFVKLNSIAQRAKMVALLLTKIASGNLE